MPFTITKELAIKNSTRFWAKVAKGGPCDCWVWQGGKQHFGHGTIRIKSDGVPTPVGAHRLSYVLHCGEIPDGLIVRHNCDNPPCVNPAHLLLGTRTDNAADMVARGRLAPTFGEHNGSRKLSDEAASQIICMLSRPNPPTQSEIAAEFGISQSTVSLIRHHKRWTHVDGMEILPPPPKRRRRLDEEDVRLIRRLLAEGQRQFEIAEEMRTTRTTICDIANGKIWAHVA